MIRFVSQCGTVIFQLRELWWYIDYNVVLVQWDGVVVLDPLSLVDNRERDPYAIVERYDPLRESWVYSICHPVLPSAVSLTPFFSLPYISRKMGESKQALICAPATADHQYSSSSSPTSYLTVEAATYTWRISYGSERSVLEEILSEVDLSNEYEASRNEEVRRLSPSFSWTSLLFLHSSFLPLQPPTLKIWTYWTLPCNSYQNTSHFSSHWPTKTKGRKNVDRLLSPYLPMTSEESAIRIEISVRFPFELSIHPYAFVSPSILAEQTSTEWHRTREEKEKRKRGGRRRGTREEGGRQLTKLAYLHIQYPLTMSYTIAILPTKHDTSRGWPLNRITRTSAIFPCTF